MSHRRRWTSMSGPSLERLRAENVQLRMDREFLKMAAAFFVAGNASNQTAAFALIHAEKALADGLRDRTDGSGSAWWSGGPSVGGPGLFEQASGDDDGVGQGTDFGAGGQAVEAAVVPGVGAFDSPPLPGLQGEALRADHALAGELLRHGAGRFVVVASRRTVIRSGSPAPSPWSNRASFSMAGRSRGESPRLAPVTTHRPHRRAL